MDTDALEKRIRRLEDIEAIKALKARYCEYCDANYDPDGIASLFVEDGVWDGGELGRAEGREKIRHFFRRAPEAFPFAIHNVMNPIIEVEGDRATGRWYLLQPCTRRGEKDEAMWLAGRYEDEYVRVGGQWRFKHVSFVTRFLAPNDEGWAKKGAG